MTTVQETRIQGRLYTLPRMSAVKSRRVLAKLVRVMGPLLDAAPRKSEDGDMFKGKSFGEVATSVLERMDDNTMESIIKDLTEGAMVAGSKEGQMFPLANHESQNIVWGEEDGGDGLLAMFDYLKWALEINYSRFFAGLRMKGSKAANASSAHSPEQGADK